MVMVRGTVLALAGLLLVCYVKAEDELLAVSVLYRHGDRTIAESYPNDPYQNLSFWPVPYGELTNTGKKQQYALGKWLRQRYDTFLSPKYLAKEFQLQASNYDRCLMSAAVNLAGLYPPENDQIWNQALPWQPIPIHTCPNDLDGILALEKPCPEYGRLSQELLKTQQYKDIHDSNEKLFVYLSEKTGKKIADISDANALYDILLIETFYNYTLPEWTESVFPEKLHQLALLRFAFETQTPDMVKIRAGQLFYKIVKQFEGFVSGDKNLPKFQVFSAHDTNVFNVLNSLRIPNLDLVPYVGTVIFELKKTSDGKHYVNFSYKRGKEPEILKIEGCTANCDYDKFIEILKPMSVSSVEWDEMCSTKEARK